MSKRDLRVVVSFFDGMSCGQQALKNLGVNYREYHSFEIEPDPIKVCKRNHPNTAFHGDVNDWRDADINWEEVDLILAGSPCQGFSFAGKQLAFDDPRSALFFVWCEFTRFMKMVRGDNVIMLLENVKMKKEYLNVITEHMGCQPVFINSELVSPQSRQRWYWSNRLITQPKDKGLLLKDILENEVDESYYHSQKGIDYLNRRGAKNRNRFDFGYIHETSRPKSRCLVANLSKGLPFNTLIHDKKNPPKTTSDFCRKLTPVECERLQGLPDGYTKGVSDTERYKMLGNGWQVDTIVHIFKDILQ